MEAVDRKLLNMIQTDFPITTAPYRIIGERLGLTEAEVLARIAKLRQQGIIRRLGATFDSQRLGYHSTLCAVKVPVDRVEEVAALINKYPGVTHNYLREHEYNLWFTLIVPTPEDLHATIMEIQARTGLPVLNLPADKMFKIRVNFDFALVPEDREVEDD
ncbi:MAG: Lrp/AsnC family transcriptional regulator [Firmicutes bacterium]|nr:Lrp/AsnC family transcriptional regulator [Bacillota bacterium]